MVARQAPGTMDCIVDALFHLVISTKMYVMRCGLYGVFLLLPLRWFGFLQKVYDECQSERWKYQALLCEKRMLYTFAVIVSLKSLSLKGFSFLYQTRHEIKPLSLVGRLVG